MKKDQVVIGNVYTAKVSGGVVPVRITDEKWTGDKHTGWAGVNTQTGRAVRIKSAQRLRAAVAAPAAEGTAAEPAVAPVAGDVGPVGEIAPEGAVLARAGSPVPPKAASGSKGKKAKGGKAKAAKPAKAAKLGKEPKPARLKVERPMSGLDAVAAVLKDAGAPMRVAEVLAVIQKKGLWMSKGKTPEATLYAAIIREIAAKGALARFVKKDRGLFAAGKGA